MGESRFTFRIGSEALSRVEFLASQGPYMSNSTVFRAGVRELWYHQDDPEIGDYNTFGGGPSRRVTVRFSGPQRRRIGALVAPTGEFPTESSVVRHGVPLVWRREMQHAPSTEMRQEGWPVVR